MLHSESRQGIGPAEVNPFTEVFMIKKTSNLIKYVQTVKRLRTYAIQDYQTLECKRQALYKFILKENDADSNDHAFNFELTSVVANQLFSESEV